MPPARGGIRRSSSTKIQRFGKFYANADTEKVIILAENNGKSGIYL